ncbi:hypothetical protein U1Q18_025024, partial [Sarracenia purpurea var. burkii]
RRLWLKQVAAAAAAKIGGSEVSSSTSRFDERELFATKMRIAEVMMKQIWLEGKALTTMWKPLEEILNIPLIS